MRGRQHQDESAHMLVNIAPEGDQAWAVESLKGDRPFLWTIAAKIEPFGRRVRKDVVISVIQIGKFDTGANLHGQQSWDESKVLLDDLPTQRLGRPRKRALEVNDGQGWVSRQHPSFADDFVASIDHGSRTRLWECHLPFNHGLGKTNIQAGIKRGENAGEYPEKIHGDGNLARWVCRNAVCCGGPDGIADAADGMNQGVGESGINFLAQASEI